MRKTWPQIEKGQKMPKKCSVYFVDAVHKEPLCKVGISASVSKRVKSLIPCCPFDLDLHDFIEFESRASAEWAERLIHFALSDYRVNGEWFSVSANAARLTYSGIKDLFDDQDIDPDDFLEHAKMAAFFAVERGRN